MATQIPQFVNRDPDAIMSDVRAQMESMLGRQLHPAQIEQLMLQIISYREVLLLERFNAGMAQLLFQFSNAPILDYIAALVAVERLPAAKAGTTIRFNLVPGHGSVVIPAGTRVSTSDGTAIFEVIEDLLIAPADEMITTLVTAQVAGKAANGYEFGFVNKILDPLAFVSSVTNIDTTGGGSDEETDEQLRERIRLAPHQFTTAGSRNSYIYHAKSASAAIIDVSVSSPIPGTVHIVALADTDSYTQIINDIYQTCSAETVRPLCDTVIVSSPNEIHYDIKVNLTLLEGSDLTAVKSDVEKALQEYAYTKSRRLGLDIVRSQISSVSRQSQQVYDVDVAIPSSNIIVNYDEVPICDSIEINITGVTNG